MPDITLSDILEAIDAKADEALQSGGGNPGGGSGDPMMDQLAIMRAEQLSEILGGITTATFAEMVTLAQTAKDDLATNLTQMGVIGIADEPILDLVAKILQISSGSGGGGTPLYLERLEAWVPFKPFPGIFNNNAYSSPAYENWYASGGGITTGNIISAEWTPNGVKFQKSWTRNSTPSGRLSLAAGRVSTIWFRPYTWPTNMNIIRYGSGEGTAGSGIKVKDGRLVILAEVLFDEAPNPAYDYWSGNGEEEFLYTDHSTYVDLGPWDSTAFPPGDWHMLAVRSKSLEYDDIWSNPQVRTVYDYYFDGVKVVIPWNTTGIPDTYGWGGMKYPNAGSSDYIHLGSSVWSYGEDIWRLAPNDRNGLNYEGYFRDWRGYTSLTDLEIADLYAEGPY